MNSQLYGGVECGGTKFVYGVGDATGEIVDKQIIETAHPDTVINKLNVYFRKFDTLAGICIGSFGPVNTDQESDNYGEILNTPKLQWQNRNIRKEIEKLTGVKAELVTDVTAAAYGEKIFGAAKGLSDFVYITIGTGIGGCIFIDGEPYSPIERNIELGHMRIPYDVTKTQFRGVCPYHGDCFEGIASGSAIHARYDIRPENLDDKRAWELESIYIALAIQNIATILQPKKVILGGGVMKRTGLLELTRKDFLYVSGSYQYYSDDFIDISTSEENGLRGAIYYAGKNTATQ